MSALEGVVRLKEVVLKNFLSHRETELSFGDGVAAIIGPNGAGKTSILDAIYFAITGDSRRGRVENLINASPGVREAYVKLVLDVGGKEVVVERRLRRGKGQEALVRVEGKIKARGAKEVNSFMEELLGISKTSLSTVAIVPQGGLTEILELRPSERLKLLDKLLGLEEFEKAWSNFSKFRLKVSLSGEVREFSISREGLAHLTGVVDSKRRELEESRRRLEELGAEEGRVRDEIKSIEGELSGVTLRAGELEKELRKFRRELEEYHKLVARRDELRKNLSEWERRLEEVEKELSTLQGMEKELARYEPVANLVSKLSRLQEVEAEIKVREEGIKRLGERLGELRGRLRRIESILSKYPEGLEEALRKFRKLSGEREELVRELAELNAREASLRTSLTKNSEAVGGIRGRLERYLAKVSQSLGRELAGFEEALTEVLRRGEELRELLEGLESELRQLDRELAAVRGKEGELRSKLELIRGSEDGRCPLCGSALNESHRREVIRKLEAELRRLREEGARLEVRLREVEAGLRKGREEFDSIYELIKEGESLRPSYEELVSLLDESRRLEKELESLRERVDSLSRREEEVGKELERLKDVESDYRLVSDLGGREGVVEEISRIEGEIRKLEEVVESLRREQRGLREEILATLGFREWDAGRVRNAVSEAQDRVRELAGLRAKLESLKSRRVEIEKRVRHLREELGRVETRISELGEVAEKVREAEVELERLRREREELSRHLGELRGRLREISRQKDEVRKREEELRGDLKVLEEVREDLNLLYWIREEILKREKLPSLIRKHSLKHIEASLRRKLEDFNLPYSDVRVEEDFTIVLTSPNPYFEIDISRLSGGELVSVAIALLLAFHELVTAGRIGFLILDEPTIHLDEERRRQFIEIVRGFRGGRYIPQLVVVTHAEEVRDAADTVFEVTRDTYSRVREVMSLG